MRCEISLHGSLAALAPGPIIIEAETVAAAIEAISRQLPGFRTLEGPRRISVVGFDTVESLFQELTVSELHIVPQFNGGKEGGFVQILIGAALVAASAGAFLLGMPAVSGFLLKMGALMVIGGLSAMLAPTPEQDKSKDISTRYLGAPGNTVKTGTRISILYGRRRVYGHFLSFDISAVNKGDEEDE